MPSSDLTSLISLCGGLPKARSVGGMKSTSDGGDRGVVIAIVMNLGQEATMMIVVSPYIGWGEEAWSGFRDGLM